MPFPSPADHVWSGPNWQGHALQPLHAAGRHVLGHSDAPARLLPRWSRAVLLGCRLCLLQGPLEQLGCGTLTPRQSALSTLDQRLQPSALCGVLWLPCQGPFTGCSQLQKAVCPSSGCQKPESRCWRGQLHPWALGAGPPWVVSLHRRWGRVPRAPGNSRGFCLVVASLPPGLLSSPWRHQSRQVKGPPCRRMTAL